LDQVYLSEALKNINATIQELQEEEDNLIL